MSALFNFSSFTVVILLTICTCAYVKGKGKWPADLLPRFLPPLLNRPNASMAPLSAAPSLLNDRTG